MKEDAPSGPYIYRPDATASSTAVVSTLVEEGGKCAGWMGQQVGGTAVGE